MATTPPLRRRLRRAFASESGGATVEFVLWLPFFFGLLLLLTDFAILAFRYSEMWDVARTTAREISLGRLPRTEQAVQAFVDARLPQGYVATLEGAHTTFFVVNIAGSPSTMSVFGILEAAVGQMTARVGLSQEALAAS